MTNLEPSNESMFEKNSKSKENINHLSSIARRNLLNGILIVGPIIEDLLNFSEDLKTKRTLTFLEELIEKIKLEFGDDFDFENLKNESFSDLLNLVLRKIENTKSEFKKNLFRDILLLKINSNAENLLFAKFVDLLDKLNEIQVILLNEMTNNEDFTFGIKPHKGFTIIEDYLESKENKLKQNTFLDSIKEYGTKEKNNEIEFYLAELFSLGLIRNLPQKNKLGGVSSLNYITTPIGEKFLSFIIKK